MRKIKLITCILLLCWLFYSAFNTSVAWSKSENDSDLLKSLDTELKQDSSSEEEDLLSELNAEEDQTEKKGFFKSLAKNLNGDVRLRFHHFWYKPDYREGIDKKFNVTEIRLKFSSYSTIGDLRLDFSGWVEAGAQDDTYAGISKVFQDKDRERRYVELSEIYLTYSMSDADLTIGKKIFKNGLSTLYSPADRHMVKDLNDPMDTKDFGLWQVKLDYYWGDYSFTCAILPVFQNSKSPSIYSRWTSSVSDEDEESDSDFYSLEDDKDKSEVKDRDPGIKLRNIAYFVKAKGTIRGWDLFLSMYQGLNPYYVLKEEKVGQKTYYIKKNIFIGEYAGGFSTTYKKWEFHGELLYNHSYDTKDDNYFNYVIGATYTIDDWLKKLHLKKMVITVEYAGETVIHEQSAKNYTKSSQETRAGRNDIFSHIRLDVSDDLIFKYESNFELPKKGRVNKFVSEYKFKSGLKWRTGLEFFYGKKRSYYGRWRKNDRIITEFIYPF